jgi:Fibronectin type III domain
MTKLVNNSTYTLSVQAITNPGTGPAATSTVTIKALPSAPTAFKATQTAAGTATMTWKPPTASGGQTITGYRVSRDGVNSSGVGAFATVVSASTRSFAMTKLVSRATYTLSVQAVTSVGTGPAATGKITIKAFPSAPTAFKVVQSATGTARMTWKPPTSSGGQTITGYRVSRDGVNTSGVGASTTVVTASTRSFAMTKLVNRATYTLSVQAITSAGTGPAATGKITIRN